MRQAPAKIQTLVQPVVETLGYELVGIEFLSQGRHSLLRIYIDSEDGITLDDCERVSHQIGGVLDVEELIHGHYNLEVSSPGLDRPLFTEEQFQRFSGQQAKVRLAVPLEGRKKFSGVIRGVSDGKLLLDVDAQTVELPINSIEKANLIPEI